MNPTQPNTVLVAVTLWSIALLIRDRLRLPRLSPPTIKFTHVLPALLQLVLFTYWAIHWSGVRQHLPVLCAQLLFAYTFDFLLHWSLKRPYSPGFGPLPIVLSANLFVWFPNHFIYHALVVAGALTSKALILSHGRHIFNPSAFGLAILGVITIVFPLPFSDVAHTLSRPPLMGLLVFLLALIPQVRLHTTPVALAAAASILASKLIVYSIIGYKGGPDPWWPPWLLAITLLSGDPATIPRSLLGRFLSGLFLGTGFYVVSRLLLLCTDTDAFGKILPIPLMNLLVPQFDHAAARLTQRWPALGAIGSRTYLAVWVAVSIVMLIVYAAA